MSENLLEEITPKTQSVEAGMALAQFLGLEELPETIALANGSRLVLSKKSDCYYMTTVQGCSCRAGQYGKSCRHRSHVEVPQRYSKMVLAVQEEASGESLYHPGFQPFLEAL